MKHTLLAALLLLSLSSIAFVQTSRNGSTSSGDEQAVHQVEDQIVAAEGRDDADALDRLYAPGYTFVTPFGQVWTKEHYLGLMRSGDLKTDSYSRDEETIRVYSNTAMVIYRSTAHGALKGQSFNSQRRVTTVLMKEDGRWLAFGRQSTPILQSPGLQTGQNAADEDAVHKVEDQIAAALDHNDADTLNRLWADDYIFVNPVGLVLTKAQRLESFRSGMTKLESYTRDQESIRVYGNMAIVIYRSTVKGQAGGQDMSSQRRVTTVLEKRGGNWQAVSQQSTRIQQQSRPN
ncbi:MAG TPA: nuclear transport factor 2 family protein [Blastocatellia bacterium]|nr:nuclear transport factor 2 family protein [Blastocatellia bacterium]